MPNVNRVSLAGHLTRDVELRYTASGTAVAEFGIGVNDPPNKKTGEKGKVHWIEIQVWGDQAVEVANTLRKGSAVMIDGQLSYESWEKEGQKFNKLRVNAWNVGSPIYKKREQGQQPAPRPAAAPAAKPATAEDDGSVPF